MVASLVGLVFFLLLTVSIVSTVAVFHITIARDDAVNNANEAEQARKAAVGSAEEAELARQRERREESRKRELLEETLSLADSYSNLVIRTNTLARSSDAFEKIDKFAKLVAASKEASLKGSVGALRRAEESAQPDANSSSIAHDSTAEKPAQDDIDSGRFNLSRAWAKLANLNAGFSMIALFDNKSMPDTDFETACQIAKCVSMAAKWKNETTAFEAKGNLLVCGLAVSLLQRAIKGDSKYLEMTELEHRLDPLRNLEEFKKLLSEVKKK
jgi:hypothetical protein